MNHEKKNLHGLQSFFLLSWLKYAMWSVFICVVAVGESLFGARRSPHLNREQKKHFWVQVQKCLVEFHGRSPEQAYQMVCQFNKDANQQLIYSHQPFFLANDLAGHDLRLSSEEWETRYLQGVLGRQKKDQTNG
jgi:hypothetical protein